MIPVNTPLLDGNEKKYLCECIDTGWISSEGPFVSRFEVEFAKTVERKHGIAVANGSVALDVAMAALRISAGDEVIMPSFTIISPAASVVRAGATPVLIDSDPITWNMDVTQIESKITSRTRAIVVVHIYGLPVDMDPVLAVAEKHGLAIVEDAAEMHGQTYRGRACGSFGDISTFSFYPNKHITTGEGGMIMTNDDSLADRCRSLRNLCFQAQRRFVHDELGWNFRMTNLQAALGLAQLERLQEFVAIKRAMGNRYLSLMSTLPHAQLPLARTDYAENIFWVFGLQLSEERGVRAQELMSRLGKRGIGTRPFFYPMHLQPIFSDLFSNTHEQFPVSERMGEFGFYVPSGLGLSPADQQIVADVVREEISSCVVPR